MSRKDLLEQSIKVLENERECVLRQDTPKCNRDELGCHCCDLLLETEEVISGYDTAIKCLSESLSLLKGRR